MTAKKILRSVEVIQEDYVGPTLRMCGPPPADESRYQRVYEVLSRIPERDYRTLVDLNDSFEWFIPGRWELAKVLSFSVTHEGRRGTGKNMMEAPYSRVVYLSPNLEEVPRDVAVASVAHELAHVFLDHDLWPGRNENDVQEKEAWELVRRWGFESEEREHEKWYAEQ